MIEFTPAAKILATPMFRFEIRARQMTNFALFDTSFKKFGEGWAKFRR